MCPSAACLRVILFGGDQSSADLSGDEDMRKGCWNSLSTIKTGDVIVINFCYVQYVGRNISASTSVINPIRRAENVFHPEIAWGFTFCFVYATLIQGQEDHRTPALFFS